MSLLTVHPEGSFEPFERYTDPVEIAKRLEKIGVLFERWPLEKPLPKEAGQEEVLKAYASEIERLKERFGFGSVDVVSVTPDHPKRKELREQFLKEHTHADFEVRFFVAGRGLFYLHPEEGHRKRPGHLREPSPPRNSGHVYLVLCEAGDLISVPAGTKHWFDMGERPDLKVIRFFTTREGWKAEFTGSDIADRFPKLEEYLKLCR